MRVKIRTAGTCSYHVLLGRFRLHLCGLNGFFFCRLHPFIRAGKEDRKKARGTALIYKGGGLSVLRDACAELF